MNKKNFVKVPESIIMNSDLSDFTIVVYIFLFQHKGNSKMNSFSVWHFSQYINKKLDEHLKSKILESLEQLNISEKIKVLNTSCGITYQVLDDFCSEKHFAILYYDEIEKLMAQNYYGTLRLLAYLRLKMKDDVFHISYEMIGRILNIDNKTVKKRCEQLQELNIVAHQMFSVSYPKKGKTVFVRFQIFANMSNAYYDYLIQQRKQELLDRKFKPRDFKFPYYADVSKLLQEQKIY